MKGEYKLEENDGERCELDENDDDRYNQLTWMRGELSSLRDKERPVAEDVGMFADWELPEEWCVMRWSESYVHFSLLLWSGIKDVTP